MRHKSQTLSLVVIIISSRHIQEFSGANEFIFSTHNSIMLGAYIERQRGELDKGKFVRISSLSADF